MRALVLVAFLAGFATIATSEKGKCNPIMDNAYGGNDILVSGKYNQHGSWQECQDSCKAIPSCMFWTWLSPDSGDSSSNFCLLKYDDNNGVIPIPGAISGARDC